jgi:hypothetical protein
MLRNVVIYSRAGQFGRTVKGELYMPCALADYETKERRMTKTKSFRNSRGLPVIIRLHPVSFPAVSMNPANDETAGK